MKLRRKHIRPVGRMTDEGFTSNRLLPGFEARWESICGRCFRVVMPGERAQYVDGNICHIGCKRDLRLRGKELSKVGQAQVIPVRKPPLCPQCYLEHVGDCL